MPTIFREGPYRFFFYSNEGNEPPHIHIEAAEERAKYWLHPLVLQWNDGFHSGELRTIEGLIALHVDSFLEEWHVFFGA